MFFCSLIDILCWSFLELLAYLYRYVRGSNLDIGMILDVCNLCEWYTKSAGYQKRTLLNALT